MFRCPGCFAVPDSSLLILTIGDSGVRLHVGKWGYTWRGMDQCGERWNEGADFLISYSILYSYVFLS